MRARFERKYRLAVGRCSFLVASWGGHLRRAPFAGALGNYPVLSQYFDTPHLTFHRQKLDGVGWRKKVRLRLYGHRFSIGEPCFLEIKERRDQLVVKRRLRFDSFHPDLLEPSRWAEIPRPEAARFALLAESLRLRPSAQVWYVREAFEGVVESDLRITVDSEVLALHPGERWSSRVLYAGCRTLLRAGEVILEIKGGEAIPAWVHRGIRWGELQQQTVPKYGLAVASLGLPQIQTGVYT